MNGKRKVCILGITGSIGRQAVDVIERNKDMYEVEFVSAHRNQEAMDGLARRVGAKKAVLTNGGMNQLLDLIDSTELDVALVGASGSDIIKAAVKLAEKDLILALANKECIVAAGKFIQAAVKESGSTLIPVDSEHSALFQCACGHRRDEIRGMVLTASGGAFRDRPAAEIAGATVEEALKHPSWSMGQKITIDSATMMNKGLELIEARFLFDIAPDKLSVVIHPQSIVHSMVTYSDGATVAQLSKPDMRIPISYALSYPCRSESGVEALDFSKAMSLEFYPPDMAKYPCLDIALRVLKSDKSAQMITMNAANEIAVERFLKGGISFGGIAELVDKTLSECNFSEPNSLEDVLEIDCEVRKYLESAG